jgi:putative ABC transport system substrate-binding protein
MDAGALLSYGPNTSDLFRRASTYIDKILKGARPSDLPMQQPTTFELTINLKTAKKLGLALPLTVLARADKMID